MLLPFCSLLLINQNHLIHSLSIVFLCDVSPSFSDTTQKNHCLRIMIFVLLLFCILPLVWEYVCFFVYDYSTSPKNYRKILKFQITWFYALFLFFMHLKFYFFHGV